MSDKGLQKLAFILLVVLIFFIAIKGGL